MARYNLIYRAAKARRQAWLTRYDEAALFSNAERVAASKQRKWAAICRWIAEHIGTGPLIG